MPTYFQEKQVLALNGYEFSTHTSDPMATKARNFASASRFSSSAICPKKKSLSLIHNILEILYRIERYSSPAR